MQEDRRLGLDRGLKVVTWPSGLDLQLTAVQPCPGLEVGVDLLQFAHRRSGVAVMETDDVPRSRGGVSPLPHQPGAVAAPARET